MAQGPRPALADVARDAAQELLDAGEKSTGHDRARPRAETSDDDGCDVSKRLEHIEGIGRYRLQQIRVQATGNSSVEATERISLKLRWTDLHAASGGCVLTVSDTEEGAADATMTDLTVDDEDDDEPDQTHQQNSLVGGDQVWTSYLHRGPGVRGPRPLE